MAKDAPQQRTLPFGKSVRFLRYGEFDYSARWEERIPKTPQNKRPRNFERCIKLLQLLDNFRGDDGYCRLSYRDLADAWKVSPKTVQRTADLCEALGLICRYQRFFRGSQQSNRMAIEWKENFRQPDDDDYGIESSGPIEDVAQVEILATKEDDHPPGQDDHPPGQDDHPPGQDDQGYKDNHPHPSQIYKTHGHGKNGDQRSEENGERWPDKDRNPITKSDLKRPRFVLRLFRIARSNGWVDGSEPTMIRFFALANFCRRKGKDPGALLTSNLKFRRWDRITNADEDWGRRTVRELLHPRCVPREALSGVFQNAVEPDESVSRDEQLRRLHEKFGSASNV